MRMAISKLLIGSAIATIVVAAAQPMIQRDAPQILLKPAVHPSVDRSDLVNLHAQNGVTLHFDSNPDPQVDSIIATVSTASGTYPIVQVDNTQYIKSVTCTSNTAEISFSNENAFNTAANDWQSKSQFILISHDPKCGSGYATGKLDYALVSRMTTDNSTLTVNAEISFVDYTKVIGEDTLVTTALNQYAAADAKSPNKRTSKSETISWNEYPTNTLTDSQWGPGYQIYSGSEVDLICVNCGTQGSMTLTGTVDWTVADGIQSANVSVNGGMSVTLEVGVDAKGISKSIPIGNMNIAQIPLASIDVPDIMTIGPQLDISASASVAISATGSMLVGATLNWPSVSASLVLEGTGTSGGSGWSPSLSPVSNIAGSISATLDLDLPVELGIGVNLLDGKYQKTIGIIDTPGLQLTSGVSTAAPCQGVDLSAGVVNNVVGDIFGLTQIPIASFTTALYSTCISTAPTTTPTPGRADVNGNAVEIVRNGRRFRKVA